MLNASEVSVLCKSKISFSQGVDRKMESLGVGC